MTETDLINAGLRLIGVQGITSLEDGTDRAFDAGLYWNNSIEAFFEAHNWSFAQRELRLPEIQEAELDIFGVAPSDPIRDSSWQHIFSLPDDFLRIVRFVKPHGHLTYQIRNYGSQWALFCNHPFTSIIYVSKDVSRLPACAREAVYLRFAMFVDAARNGGTNTQNLQQMYAQAFAQVQSLEPTTHDRKRLDWGELNRVRHEYDESANHRFAHELCQRNRQSGYLE